MIFFAGNDGTIICSQNEAVYQGAAGANNIYLYAPFAQNLSVEVAFVLPNNQILPPEPMTPVNLLTNGNSSVINSKSGAKYAAWQYTLPNSVTQIYGTVTVQFYVITSTNKRTPTSASSFIVGRGVPVELPETPDSDVYEQILAAISNIQSDLANGYFVARGFYPYSSVLSYGVNELVWYPMSGTRGSILKSLVENNTQPPYIDGVLNSENWAEVVDFDELYGYAEGAAESAASAQQSAASAQQSAAQAYLYLQKTMAEATNIFYLTLAHSSATIKTDDFQPRPLAENANKILAVSSDGFLAQYSYSATTDTWLLLTADDGAFNAVDLNGAGIKLISAAGTTPEGDAIYSITLTNGTSYTFIAPKGDKGDRGDSLIITEWYDSFAALSADFESTSVATGQYAAIKYTLDYYQKGDTAWIYLGNLRFAAGDIAIGLDEDNRPYATLTNTSEYSVEDLKNEIQNGDVIAGHAANADSLGGVEAAEYYSKNNKPTAADVGLGNTLSLEIAGTTTTFDGSENKNLTVLQKYIHAITLEYLAKGGSDFFRGNITVIIVLDTSVKQSNQLTLGNRLFEMGYTSQNNFYPCFGQIIINDQNTAYPVNGIFCSEENTGLTIVYNGVSSHYFGENSTRTAQDGVIPILSVSNN